MDNITVQHGIYADGIAYSRRSVYDLELTPEQWNLKEEKRVARALAAKEKGIKIDDKYLLVREKAEAVEINIPKKFMDRMDKIITYRIFGQSDELDPLQLMAMKLVWEPVEFTVAYNHLAMTISITHKRDNFERKEGNKKATALLKGATTAFNMKNKILNLPNIYYF